MTIPNELSAKFNTQEDRKKILQDYADSDTMFVGENEDGERVYLSVAHSGMVLRTEQDNGWVRVNYYDDEGCASGESFDGKWK